MDDAELVAKLSEADFEAPRLVAKLSDLDAVAPRLLLEVLSAAALSVPAAVVLVALLLEPLLVELLEDAPLAALRLSAPLATLVDVAPPPVEELLVAELPTLVALPFFLADALAAVLLEVPVVLVALPKFAVTPRVAEALFELVVFKAALAAEAFVVPVDRLALEAAAFVVALDLLEFAPKLFVVPLDSLAFSAKPLVVALALFAVTEAEDDSFAPKLLLSLACCVLLVVSVLLLAFESVVEFRFEYDVDWLAVWLSDEFTLEDELLFAVTFELLFTVSSLFCPRL